jgi:hypothetical protein
VHAAALNEVVISRMSGRCEALGIAGRTITRTCHPQLFAVLYPDGTISFVFSWGKGEMISFKGKAGHSNDLQTTLKVEKITTVRKGGSKGEEADVIGSCVFTRSDPRLDRLDCLVKGASGSYSGSFQTDGSEPTRFISR